MQGRSYPTPHGGILSATHGRVLEGSGIAPEVIAERGVCTVRKGRGQLPSTYSRRQKKRTPGILFTVHRPSGQTATIFRPDEPDPKNPGHKYEQESKHYGGAGNVLDVHPSARHLLADERVPVVFTEGIKKGDSITSAARATGIDLMAVAISGVYNWMSGGEPIPDMLDVPVKGRRTLICFDSDMLRNPQVQDAAERLAEHLRRREADLEIVYLPDQSDGSKNGADDFLIGGGTLVELMALARPYRPGDLQREKLTRNEKLRRVLADLTRREEEIPVKSQRGCSMRSAWRVCLTLAEKRGQLVADGIEVVVPAMTGAEMAAVSQPTFSKCMTRLEEAGRVRRIRAERSEHADSYVLLMDPSAGGVSLYNNGQAGQGAGKVRDTEKGSDPGYKAVPPLPEMRWSAPGRKARRGLVEGTRRVRQGKPLAADAPSKRRPGKKRDEVVRHLAENGGEATRAELLERFGGSKTTWRDFKKQTLADLLGRRRQYRDQPLSVGPPVVELTDEGIRFVQGWAEAWEEHRTIGAEQEAADEQKRNHLMQRIAYRRRNERPADPDPGKAEEESGADGFIEELQPEADDWRGHPFDCECEDCLCASTTTYVRLGGGA
jgi:hypothetical protein